MRPQLVGTLPRRLRALGINLLVVAGSVLVTCLVIELGLKVAGFPRQESRFVCYDVIMGNVFCPGAAGEYRSHGVARELRINADGLADSTHTRAKPADTLRIALLGDSMVAGLDVDPQQRIASLWERELSAALGQRVEVVNFAVPGTGTWEQLQMYHLRVREYRPDLVVVAFFWGNDVWNNAARRGKGGGNPLEDDYRVRGKDRIRVLHRSFTRWLWNHSILYQVVRTGSDRLTELNRQAAIHGWADALARLRADAARAEPQHLEPQVGMSEYDWSSADWVLTRQLLQKLAEKTRSDHTRLAVFQIPALIHVREQLPRAQFDAFLRAIGVPTFGLFELYDTQSRQEMQRQFIVGDVHWNALGHARAAEHTLPALVKRVAALPTP